MDNRPMISIVDDDESMRDAAASLIRSAGYVPKAYPCARDFLESEHVRESACLIADIQMPGMTGLELHGELIRSGNEIPTILITAFPDEKMRERALRAGVVGYLAKPFTDSELLTCIESALTPGDTRRNQS
jgi:FixJ family two-component response regulator